MELVVWVDFIYLFYFVPASGTTVAKRYDARGVRQRERERESSAARCNGSHFPKSECPNSPFWTKFPHFKKFCFN